MDINTILRKNGYQQRPDFVDIIRWAVKHAADFAGEAELIAAVEAKFTRQVAAEQPVMRSNPAPYHLWSDPSLPPEKEAVHQLETALSLPVAVGGAGMPDLHVGYSLPIGGVVVLDNAVSPAFVGYDISCMMMLTVLDTPSGLAPAKLTSPEVRRRFLAWVQASTSFGLGASTGGIQHPVMDDPLWREVPFLRGLKGLAADQLGTSGAGNHFADIVTGRYVDGSGEFVALLTHSGSRGIGNKVGHEYAVQADRAIPRGSRIPAGYGWFDIHSAGGAEYLAVMRLMGEYAYANHEIIHARFLRACGLERKTMIWNRHNYAWVDETGQVCHRKGATPAEVGQMGIIPGSSGSDSFLVSGKGCAQAWNSASHGAGRPYSRSEAKRRYDPARFEAHMRRLGITHSGVAADETVAAYKDIQRVMAAQAELVNVLAVMSPRVVVMGGGHADDGD